MRTVGVITVGRSDYGIYKPILQQIQADPNLRVHLIVAGMHLSPEFGLTITTIEADGFEIAERVEMLLSADTPAAITKSMGLGLIGFAQAFARLRPDILLVLGDRFEMHAAALTALPFKIPVAHIHGGEITQGAIDDALRHSITKLSHLHFVATEEYARRVQQLGEEPWRITVCGAPGLDNIGKVKVWSTAELEAKFGLHLDSSPLLVTFHPVTLEYEKTEWQVSELLTALEVSGLPVIFTLPNADTQGRVISRMIKNYVQWHPLAQWVDNLGIQGYFSLMAMAAAMVGNSSSGIIEAPSFKLPVVNIGTRQQGRVRATNVIDCGYRHEEIITAIKKAVQPTFRESLSNSVNPYGQGQAANMIVKQLQEVAIDDRLLVKHFYDLSFVTPMETTRVCP